MTDPTKLVGEVLEGVDDNIYSRQESEADRTSRHLADMTSDNKLAKMIRPMLALGLFVVWATLMVSSIFTKVEPEALYSSTAAMMAAIGFYFESRRAEKINAKKASAGIQIEKMRTRHEIRLEKKQARRNRKKKGDEMAG